MNASFIILFLFAFLTTTFVPKEQLTGWLAEVATYNPVTYLLEGLRSLLTEGFVAADLLKAVLAILAVGSVSLSLALASLRGRIARG